MLTGSCDAYRKNALAQGRFPAIQIPHTEQADTRRAFRHDAASASLSRLYCATFPLAQGFAVLCVN